MLLSPWVRLVPALAPTAILLPPASSFQRASAPTAVLLLPVSKLKRAPPPMAALRLPLVLFSSAESPTATLTEPLVKFFKASLPMATLNGSPAVTFKSALSPRIVLSCAKQPSWQTARACGESAKQTRVSGMSSRVIERYWQIMERLSGRADLFISAEDCKKLALLSSILLKALAISVAVFWAANDGSALGLLATLVSTLIKLPFGGEPIVSLIRKVCELPAHCCQWETRSRSMDCKSLHVSAVV